MKRKSIKVNRKPVTCLSEKGYKKKGGWMVFAKPTESTPPISKIKGKKGNSFERVLWCPYCGEWTVYEQEYSIENGRKRHVARSTLSVCQGSCSWAHTREYNVVTANNLWGEM